MDQAKSDASPEEVAPEPDLPFPYIDYDPYTGIAAKYVKGEGKKWHVHYEQDVEKHLDINKVRQNDGSNGYGESRDLRLVAHIPDIIYIKWRNDYGLDFFNKDHWPAIRRKLNDPDWQYLKTIPGRI